VILRALAIIALGGALGLVHGRLAPVEFGIEASPEQRGGPASDYTARGAPFLTPEAAHRRFEAHAAFVDARGEDEFADGHIRGAVRLAPADFSLGYPERLDEVPRNLDVVVYCGDEDCDAAILVARRLREFGYEPVFVFEGGLAAWSARGFETVRE
jgi:rhodanese-related sulfurtransferase